MSPSSQVSVVVVAYNEEGYIERCIKAVLNQSFSQFELVIVDDASDDRTPVIIKNFDDPRIIYYRNPTRSGIAHSRNAGIGLCKTPYVFFTDADCVPSKYWLEEGFGILKNSNCEGIAGRTCYETAETSISDRIIQNINPGEYLTTNIVYKRDTLMKVGGFNESYKLVSEDTDIAKRILKLGEIAFAPEMIVFHQRKTLTARRCFDMALRVFSKVKYIKDTGDFGGCTGRIMYPTHAIFIVCPPLLLLHHRFLKPREIFLVIPIYLSYVLERLFIWTAAVKERIFLI